MTESNDLDRIKTGAVVLFSGGQDSTTCLYWAKLAYSEVHALTIDYGQRHIEEVSAAVDIAQLAGVPHTVLDVPAIKQLDDSDLLRPGAEITERGTQLSSFVPGRNLIMVSLAASLAFKIGFTRIVAGVHYPSRPGGYPDCRPSFFAAASKAVNEALGTDETYQVVVPMAYKDKQNVVLLARSLTGCWDALRLTVTCFNGKRPGCGTCPACKLRAKGFADAGFTDPHFD